jgi:hypothetical protein
MATRHPMIPRDCVRIVSGFECRERNGVPASIDAHEPTKTKLFYAIRLFR